MGEPPFLVSRMARDFRKETVVVSHLRRSIFFLLGDNSSNLCRLACYSRLHYLLSHLPLLIITMINIYTPLSTCCKPTHHHAPSHPRVHFSFAIPLFLSFFSSHFNRRLTLLLPCLLSPLLPSFPICVSCLWVCLPRFRLLYKLFSN